jgi:hypothetical protein
VDKTYYNVQKKQYHFVDGEVFFILTTPLMDDPFFLIM